MAQRRDRPTFDLAGGSLNVTLPDGRTVPIPARSDPASADSCCFCGQAVAHSDLHRVRVTVRWIDGDQEHEQSWSAHRGCLLERMHPQVQGQGPFSGEA
jgi:hypothetical protein